MIWHQRYGKDYEFLVSVERQRRKPIKPLNTLPILSPEEFRLATAYTVLSNSRGGSGPIALSEIHAYCQLQAAPSEWSGLSDEIIRINSIVMIQMQKDQREKDNADHKPTHQHRRQGRKGRRP